MIEGQGGTRVMAGRGVAAAGGATGAAATAAAAVVAPQGHDAPGGRPRLERHAVLRRSDR
jgi:hypothetical protein